MVRAPCCEKMGLKKGPWTPEEDQVLINYIKAHGHSNWRALPKQSGLLRCGKSCRLRWINYLRPDIKRGNFTREEEDTIVKLHEMLGNRWSAIAARLPGRTDNEIKNVWHTHLKKRLKKRHQHEVSDTTGSPMKALNLDIDAKKEQDPMNVNTTHMTETESQEPRQPLSPSQSSWSNDDITSSNITKNSYDSNENENNSSTNADGSSSSTMHLESHWDFPQVDESFWSEVWSVDSDIGADKTNADVGNDFQGVAMNAEPQWQLQFSPWVAMEPIDGQSTSKDKVGANMDFWLDLFTSATLPEM